jgi:tetratricopeptide (TPR) repeat protein
MSTQEEDIAIRHALNATDHYKLLLVSQEASEEQVKRAYLQLSRKLHPDKAPTNSRHRAETAFKRLSEAFATLSDPIARANYNEQLLEEAQVEERLRRDFEANEIRRHTEQSAQLKQEADDALTAGKLQEAVKIYTRAIGLDPSNASLFSNRAAAYLSLGKCTDALADAETGLERRPGWAKLYSRKATALDALQRYNEAIETWRAAVDAEDQTGTPEGGWVEPLKLAEQALANKVDQLKRQAAEALSKGRVDQAVQAYTHAIGLDDKNATLFSNRSAAYLSLGEYVEALGDAETGLKLRNDWAKLHGRKATALDGLCRYSESIKAWRAAIDAADQTGSPEEGWQVPLKLAEHKLVEQVEQLKQLAEEAIADGRIDEAVETYSSAIAMALEPFSRESDASGMWI